MFAGACKGIQIQSWKVRLVRNCAPTKGLIELEGLGGNASILRTPLIIGKECELADKVRSQQGEKQAKQISAAHAIGVERSRAYGTQGEETREATSPKEDPAPIPTRPESRLTDEEAK